MLLATISRSGLRLGWHQRFRLDVDWGVVIAALVTAVGGVVTTLLLKVRKENTNDHASVMEILRSVGGKVERIDSKLDSHIDWHLKEATGGEVSKRN
jgi:hypothetical protein